MEEVRWPELEVFRHPNISTYTPLKNEIKIFSTEVMGVSYTLVRLILWQIRYITRKMVPIPKRASSFLVVVFIHVNRKEEEGETEQQQFTKGCNILHRLQVYHLTLTFVIHNKYMSTLYLYTYMHYYDCSNNNAFY